MLERFIGFIMNKKAKGFQKINDEIIKNRTGKSTKEWNKILDRFNVKVNWHRLAAKFLLNKYRLSPWWSQVVVIRYEYIRGLRK